MLAYITFIYIYTCVSFVIYIYIYIYLCCLLLIAYCFAFCSLPVASCLLHIGFIVFFFGANFKSGQHSANKKHYSMHPYSSVCIRMYSYASITHLFAPIGLHTLPLCIRTQLFNTRFRRTSQKSQNVKAAKFELRSASKNKSQYDPI